MTDHRSLIARFLAAQTLGVVSTIGTDGQPQSALVAFSETPELKIVFGTFNDSRKFRNLQRDPRASFVISGNDATVQLEGTARLAEGTDDEQCRALHIAKNPGSAKYLDDPRQRFFIVTPMWIRYTDYSTEPDTVLEVSF